MRRAWLVLAAALALAGRGCGDGTGPVSGELVVRLTTPSSDDRAILLRLSGSQTAIRAAPGRGYAVYSSSAVADTTVIAVVAPQGSALAAGELLRVSVPDTRKAGSYAAIPTQVAGADYQLRDAGQYSLVVAKP